MHKSSGPLNMNNNRCISVLDPGISKCDPWNTKDNLQRQQKDDMNIQTYITTANRVLNRERERERERENGRAQGIRRVKENVM